MADIHINFDHYGNEQDELINKMVNTFKEIADKNLKEIEGKFLFEYINQHNQFDLIEFPETDDKIFPNFIEIDNEFPNCFIAGLKYYKNI
jgi:hypothetical protein